MHCCLHHLPVLVDMAGTTIHILYTLVDDVSFADFDHNPGLLDLDQLDISRIAKVCSAWLSFIWGSSNTSSSASSSTFKALQNHTLITHETPLGMLRQFKFIMSFKFSLCCLCYLHSHLTQKVIYSLLLGIKIWTSLGCKSPVCRRTSQPRNHNMMFEDFCGKLQMP